MTEVDVPRSAAARAAAERALVRVCREYGGTPDFVLLGGLMPALLCAGSAARHAGTTDVDVQVNLEIIGGAANTRRLEGALRAAGFVPGGEHIWRWRHVEQGVPVVIKFELLADLDDQPNEATVEFDDCDDLGAVNLRGTRFAALDARRIAVSVDGGATVQVLAAGLAGFLLAKVGAARSRRKPKDWYDIAFVLLHNDAGGPDEAARQVRDVFEDRLPEVRTALYDLRANFDGPGSQGASAYAEQFLLDHPEEEPVQVEADAVLAVRRFCDLLG